MSLMIDWFSKMQSWWSSSRAEPRSRVMGLLAEGTLGPVYQPMADLHGGVILGHEALIRSRREMSESVFEALWEMAKQERCLKAFEVACLEMALSEWARLGGKGQLFVNFSAQSLMQLQESDGTGVLLHHMRKHGLPPRRVGLELSGYSRTPDIRGLAEALRPLRDAGVTLALDNFKASENSMNAWARLLPNMLKMAPRWTHNIAVDTEQIRIVRSMVRLARNHNAVLLAKAVETEAELCMLKSLGVDMAQGFFVGSPATEPVRSLNLRARGVLQTAEDTKQPESVKARAPVPVVDTRYSLLS